MEQKGTNYMDENPFFSNEQMINHYPDKFIIDFRNILHQFVGNEGIAVLNHRVIIMDPWIMKNFMKAMQDNVAKYESRYGEIKKPDSVAKFEVQHKELHKDSTSTSDRPDYMG